MIGSSVGPYRIVSELGAGGMGTVYLGEDADGGRAAVKVVHPHLIATPGFFKRFLREAEVGRKVQHENVVRTLDVDATIVDGQQVNYMVMEYVEGKSLRTLLGELKTIPEALLREITLQMAAGLGAIHAAEIVHRDLKPENVLITEDQRVRIMDLGVAKLQEASIALTKEGQFAGSVLYAAPEQFRGGDVGPAADLYSLGVMLYELATGDNPFRRDDPAAVIQAHLALEPPRVTDRNSEISPLYGEIVRTLLAKCAADRVESAAFLHDLMRDGERSSWWAEREPLLRQKESRLPRIRVGRETELHGRAEDLDALQAAWARAVEGAGNVVYLEGEAGIGKTRLVDAFTRTLGDAHVLYGSYPPSGGMGGLSDAILGKFGETALEQALHPYLTVTPALLPAFAALVKHESVPSTAEPLRGDALHTVLVHLARALAAEKPTLWIAEDLHFATKDSRDSILALARGVTGHRILLVATGRPGVETDHFSRLDGFERRTLGRLGARDVIHLLADAFRSDLLADKLGARIAVKSDGVPFFIFELIRGLKEGNLVQQQADGTYVQAQQISEIEVPSAVKDLIEARLRGLGDEDRNMLDVAAVQGLEFESDLVARVLEQKRVQVLQRLAAIERRSGIVRAEGGRYRFDQNQIQEVLYSGLSAELRQEYHTLLAEAAAARGDDDPCFLAHHHLRGSRPAAARPHVVPAVDALARSYRNEAAADLAERALRSEGLLTGKERVEVLLGQAGRLGILGRREPQRAALDEAAALAEVDADLALRAAVALQLGGFHLGVRDLEQAAKTFEEAIALAEEAGDRTLVMKSARGLGNTLYYGGRRADARGPWERSLAIARENGDRDGEAAAIINLGNIGDDPHERRRLYGEGIRLAREVGNRLWEATATGNLSSPCLHLGEYAAALECTERALALHRAVGNRAGEVMRLVVLAMLRRLFGQPDEARRVSENALRIAREIQHPQAEAVALRRLARLHEDAGRLPEAEELFRRLPVLDASLIGGLDLGRVLQKQGRADEARAEFERAFEEAERKDSKTVMAVAAVHLGETVRVRSILAEKVADFEHEAKMTTRFLLWRAEGQLEDLEEANRLLLYARDHAPAEVRDSMIENVPLHREIRDAWEGAGFETPT